MFTLVFTLVAMILFFIASIINDLAPEQNKHQAIKPALVGIVLVLAGMFLDFKIILKLGEII